MKSKKSALLKSLIALLLCLSMLVGTTFAWFTDSVSTGLNTIAAGNLDVELYHTNAATRDEKVDASTDLFLDLQGEDILWEPGVVSYENLRVVNEGDLALAYQMSIATANENHVVDPSGAIYGLSQILKVGVVEGGITATDRAGVVASVGEGNWITLGEFLRSGSLLPQGDAEAEDTWGIVIYWQPGENDNFWNLNNGKVLDQGEALQIDLGINLIATQEVYESDSFGSDYDTSAKADVFPEFVGGSASAPVVPDGNNCTSEAITMTSGDVTAVVPAGAQLAPGTTQLTLTVTEMEATGSNVQLNAGEAMRSLDVHIEGIDPANTAPITVALTEVVAKGLNMGNYKLYHVENGTTNEMTLVDSAADFSAHNQFKYDPATGNITLYMASFSEVAIAASPAVWTGAIATDFAGGTGTETDPYIIANADQLAFLNKQVSNGDDYSADKYYKLIADITFESKTDDHALVWYPIGYWHEGEGANKAGETEWYTYGDAFQGVFDGAGHVISGIYQNTWVMDGNYDNGYWDEAMGLFGYVYGGTVKNLTIDNFYSEGEFTPTGCVAAYAANSTFENIAITNSHPQTYNTSVAAVVGRDGKNGTNTNNGYNLIFKNITVDSSNTVSALWGSWDVGAAGLLGYLGSDSKVLFENCNVAATIDVYNDVCGNYQYYWYRYCGAYVGTVNKTKSDSSLDLSNVTAKTCTVDFGNRHEYYYCEFVENTKASYTHDYQMSRVDLKDIVGSGESATCQNHNHEEHGYETVNGVSVLVEDKQAVYLPFRQLFGGYGWGVDGVDEYENIDITTVANTEKFEKNDALTGDFIYRVGNKNAFSIGKLFQEIDGATVVDSGVYVSVTPMLEGVSMEGTFEKKANWEDSTLHITGGTGLAKLTIQDYNNCKPFEMYVEIVDAYNDDTKKATESDVVLLSNISSGEFTVSNGHTFYGNGFKVTCAGKGYRLNVAGMYGGFVEVEKGGVLDNVQIFCDIYPVALLYSSEAKNYKNGDVSTAEKTYYNYQLSAVAVSGNGSQVLNSYVYGGRNNIYVGDGNVTIANTTTKNGVLSNIQIKSTDASSVILRDVTTVQEQVTSTYDTSKTMMGCGILVGDPETSVSNPKLIIQGEWKHYNWVTSADAAAISNEYADDIINTALSYTDYVHEKNDGTKTVNLGIIFLNRLDANIDDQRTVKANYLRSNIDMTMSVGITATIQGQVYSIVNDGAPDNKTPEYKPNTSLEVKPTPTKDESVGGNKDTNDGGDDTRYCYWEDNLLKLMYKENESAFALDVANLVKFQKHGYDLSASAIVTMNGKEVPTVDGKVTFTDAGNYVITYIVEDDVNFDNEGNLITEIVEWEFPFNVEVSVVENAGKNAEIKVETNSFYGSYGKTSGLDPDYHYNIPFMKNVAITDYADDGVTGSTFDVTKNIIKTEVTGDKSGGSIKLYYLDGRSLTVTFGNLSVGFGSYSAAVAVRTYNNQLWISTEGVSNNPATVGWQVTSYKFVGNNGVPVEYTDPRTCNFDSASTSNSPQTSWSNFKTPTIDAIKYTVTFDANGGSCTKQFGYVTTGSPSVTLPTPTRSGYIFAGWYTAASGGTRVGGAGDSYTPSANITLYAQWGKPCTVTYNANGGTCGTASEKYTGTALKLPTPTRDGYWFIGWYDAAEGGDKIGEAGATYNPGNEITLYAHWQEKVEYTVTYNANGGSCGTTSATYQGTALPLPTPTRTGYNFLGWYTAASGGTKIEGTTYTPSANVTLYAQWQINSYTITVTTNNATVKVNGTTVANNGTVSIQYGAQVTVEVTYSKPDSRSTTIKGTDGTSYTSPFNMPAQNVTIHATSTECVTPDTLITLANGKQVRVDSLTGNEELLVWNLKTGKYEAAPIVFVDSEEEAAYEIIHLYFSDGSDVKVIYEHGFFDLDLGKYVYIDATNYADYIGHRFVAAGNTRFNKWKIVTLDDVVIETEVTTAWSPVTFEHLCYYTNGVLSMPGGIEGLFNIFDVDTSTMRYDAEKMQKDIETYGLFTLEDFGGMITEDAFNAFNGAYLKVAMGKGLLTWEDIAYMAERYIPLM